jgi:predicted DNA binding CopG/RHH family protein
MKKLVGYEKSPYKLGKVIPDFLPKPEDLVRRETNVRVTLNLSNASVGYFRALGKKSHMPYQKLIRRLLDEYVRKAA